MADSQPALGTSIELEIGGMTCASCAMRIEKKLNKIEGVTATVNYATEKAAVSVPDGFDPAALIAEVEKTGYTAALPTAQSATPGDAGADADRPDAELTGLRQRLIGAVVLAVPVILLAMVPALQFTYWQWASLVLAAPVVVWAAWPFHQAAWVNLRHGAATMDTLISLGTLAALLWSLYALFFGTAGVAGMTHWDGGAAWLAVAVFINTLISLFYYLRWIVPTFTPAPAGLPSTDAPSARRWPTGVAVVTSGVSVAFGIAAGIIWN